MRGGPPVAGLDVNERNRLREKAVNIGPFLPPGAGTTAVRNTIYFGGNEIQQSLLVLAAYLVVGGVLLVGISRRSKSQPIDADTDIETAAAGVVVV